MPTRLSPGHALVFGGTGAIGSEVLHGLSRAGVPATFTYASSEDKARALAALGHTALRVDLRDPTAIRAAIAAMPQKPDILIHCAAVTNAPWDDVLAVNVRSAAVAVEALAPEMAKKKNGHVVFLGALDRTQSLPLPPAFAASQGALSALAMAFAKEHGKDGIRVNLIAVGLLETGLSAEIGQKLSDDFALFSALRRRGTAAEVAKTVLWLALENTYVSGKVLSVNGGI